MAFQRAQDFGCNSNTCTGLGSGTLGGQFQYPTGIAVDYYGNIYVADSGNNRIQKFFSDGSIATEWGSKCDMSSGAGCIDSDGTSGPLSSGDGQFSGIGDIAVDSLNNVYALDYGNDRIEVFAQK